MMIRLNRKEIVCVAHVCVAHICAAQICAALLIFTSLAALISCSAKGDARLSVDKKGRTVVERCGQLQVIRTALCDSAGNPVQLRGISSGGLQRDGKYANETVLRRLRDDWNMQIWRAAMYTLEGGYIQRPAIKRKVIESVDAAIALGLYVIIDWHILSDGDPRRFQTQAIEFFTEMAQKYGEYPNVIYEICNEPNGLDTTWKEAIKPYAEEVIPVIRQYDPDNIIVVGTPNWSQRVNEAADDPITGYDNIMYALHFYAGTHGQWLQDAAADAIASGLPLFVTECGTSEASGGGGVYETEFLTWLSFLQKNNISWVNWSLTNNGEESGILVMNADRDGKGLWTENDLSQSGRFIRKIFRNETRIR